MHLLRAVLPLFLTATAASLRGQSPTNQWEAEIRAFEAAERTNPPPAGAVVFVGSSSIRLWQTLAQDFPEHRVVNRGFGGSQLRDAVNHADRIVTPCKPRLVVLYAGDNDLASGKTPAQVLADFQAFVAKVHAALPETRVAFISIKPSPKRWHLADQVRAVNRLIADFTRGSNRLEFIDVFTPMLGADGRPQPELFVADDLHLNAKGYELWRKIIAPRLAR
jgi:lysophospholipase L1-like esterase